MLELDLRNSGLEEASDLRDLDLSSCTHLPPHLGRFKDLSGTNLRGQDLEPLDLDQAWSLKRADLSQPVHFGLRFLRFQILDEASVGESDLAAMGLHLARSCRALNILNWAEIGEDVRFPDLETWTFKLSASCEDHNPARPRSVLAPFPIILHQISPGPGSIIGITG